MSELLETALAESAMRPPEALGGSDRFTGLLKFGTAGLRGEIAGGPHRMNRAVVIRAAAGLSAFLAEHCPDGDPFTVVIGCDARYGSADFARDTAAVVTAAGGRALLLPAQLPTPVLAFAVQHLQADAGVMVTASHNPPRDTGYKVYLGLRPLTALDAQTAAHAWRPDRLPRPDAGTSPESSVSSVRAEAGWKSLGSEVVTAYLDAIARAALADAAVLCASSRPLRSVGRDRRALEAAGFADVRPVESQRDPDPDFPTVAFPNPEEAGALDEAIALADDVQADLIIANDPDADRMSAAVPAPDGSGWYQLSGDEVGLLLGEAVAQSVTSDDAEAAEGPVFDSSSPPGPVPWPPATGSRTPHITGFSGSPRARPGLRVRGGWATACQLTCATGGISAAVLFAAFTSPGMPVTACRTARASVPSTGIPPQPPFRLEDTSTSPARWPHCGRRRIWAAPRRPRRGHG